MITNYKRLGYHISHSPTFLVGNTGNTNMNTYFLLPTQSITPFSQQPFPLFFNVTDKLGPTIVV
jgi:hypothetical protein